jgi:hypothetical protein
MQIKSALDMIQQALTSLPAGSEVHKDALQAVTRLSRHMPQGIPTAGAQTSMLQNMLGAIKRNAVMQQLQAQQTGMGGGPSPAPAIPGQ